MSVPVTVTVWDFAIPSQSSLTTAFGFDTWGTYQGVYGATWDTNKIVAMTNRYSEAALQMRISMYGIEVADPSYTFSGGKILNLDWSLWNRTEEYAGQQGHPRRNPQALHGHGSPGAAKPG